MITALRNELWFPPIHRADGLVAMGGDLETKRLLHAYAHGIFPWYDEHSPILWWSPNPRCVLPLNKFKISKRLQRKIKNGPFHCTMNQCFDLVMQACAKTPRPGQDGTWLLPEMQEAYMNLHQLGFGHSVECWRGAELVGGIYGLALGKAFFGESMFYHVSDASKIALSFLVAHLRNLNFRLFDCQQETEHMLKMGACLITRASFNELLKEALLAGNFDVKRDIYRKM